MRSTKLNFNVLKELCNGFDLKVILYFIICFFSVLFVCLYQGKSFDLIGVSNRSVTLAIKSLKIVSPNYPVTDSLYDYEYSAYNFKSWTPKKGYKNTEITLSKSRGYLLEKDNSDHKRVVYQLHGGAYITPFSANYNEVAINYSLSYDDADVFSLDNRVASEDMYPAALDDAQEGYEWLLEQGYKASDIVIAGDSSGGGLALALALKLKDNGKNLPRCLILSSPWANLTQSGFSYISKSNVDVYFGNSNESKLPTLYATKEELFSPYVSPVYGDYHGMPPILIQTGSDEMLLSDSKMIEGKAKEAGIEFELNIYEGMWHVFYIESPKIHESRVAWSKIKSFIASVK